MNKETLEHISSLMDGELSRETGLFLTRRLSADHELTGTWQRYHLIRDCMRQPGGAVPLVNLSQRMKNALSEEQSAPASVWSSNRWLKPVSGLAVAASVALMAIVAVGPDQQLADSDIATGPAVQPFSSPNILPAVPRTQAASFSPQSQAEAQAREAKLNSYLLRHNQSSSSFATQGFLGFVPIVSSAETEKPATDDANVAVEGTPDSDPR